MTRLLISVEGLSERIFVEKVLVSHLATFEVFVGNPHNMKGNINLDKVANKLNDLSYNYDFVTTFYDFYGFKKRGLNSDETKESLEQKIKQGIRQEQREKVIPYIQMYEFEALLFSNVEKMATELQTEQAWINSILGDFNNNPENINNSKETAPSKRIEKNVKYIKTLHAPKILQEIRLPEIRKKCRGFDKWITQLEKIR